MNWLAIGILSLLALSMMMSSKHLRVITGTLAVVVVTAVAALLFLGMRALPSAGDLTPRTRPFFSWSFQITKPNLRETAEDISARVLAGMDHDHADLIDEPVAVPDDEHPPIDLSTQATDSDKKSSHPQPHGQFVFVEHFTLEPSISSSVPHEVTVQEKMASVIRAYLKKHHNPRLDPGVDQLEPEDLNWRLLHFHYKGTDKSQAVKRVTIVFDDEFHNHVRKRGRELVTKDHLMKAGFASGGTLAVLITLFGLLKLKQARREAAPAKDLLASSGVWMV